MEGIQAVAHEVSRCYIQCRQCFLVVGDENKTCGYKKYAPRVVHAAAHQMRKCARSVLQKVRMKLKVSNFVKHNKRKSITEQPIVEIVSTCSIETFTDDFSY